MPLAAITRRPLGHLLLATAAAALLVATPARAEDERYGYYRVVEGSANFSQDGTTDAVVENHPLLTGDRLWTGRGSRVEVVLPDGTVARLGGDGELTFDTLATSGDADAESTLLYLQRGELQVVTEATAGVSAYPRIDTDDATVYLEGAGSYRIETNGASTQVVVRRGSAEVASRRGTVRLDEDEAAWVAGDARPTVSVADGWSSLERWGTSLDDDVRSARLDDSVDSRLRYDATRMDEYGSWVEVENRRAWRPRVGADWSPYRHGRWTYTPSGMTWVSYEPWGWVPYHYGSWDYVPGWGWVWYAGRTYAPAWVYWYWGPSQVGWCPIGYYYRHYRPRYYGHYGWDFTFGFRFGIHGWAGGSPRHWDRWNFVDCGRINDRRLAIHTRSGSQLGAALGDLPRGVITTDTRPIRRAVAIRPAEGMRVLSSVGSTGSAVRRELPDLTRFVARDPDVPVEVARQALPIDSSRVEGEAGGPRNGRPSPGVGSASPRGDRPTGASEGSPRVAPSRPTTVRPRGSDDAAGSASGSVPRVRVGDGDQTSGRPGRAVPADSGEEGSSRGTPRVRQSPPASTGPDSQGEAPVVRPRRPPTATDGNAAPRVVRPPVVRPSGGDDRGDVDGRTRPPATTASDRSPTRGTPPSSSGSGGEPEIRRRASPPASSDRGDDAGGSGGVRRPVTVTPRDNDAPPRGTDSGGARAVPPVRRVVDNVRRPESTRRPDPIVRPESVRRPEPPRSSAPPPQSGSGGGSSYEPRRPAAPRSDDGGGAVRSRDSGGSDRGGSRGSSSSGSSRGSRTRSSNGDPDRR